MKRNIPLLQRLVMTCSLLTFLLSVHAQTMMPMPAHGSVYTGSARGFWFIAPCNFVITGLRVPIDAGTGAQYIHVMKCRDPFPVATSGSTNFVTLSYIFGAPNNTIQTVNIPITAGDTIGILGTAGTNNSYTASSTFTTTINGFTVPIMRLGYQGDINTAPAPNYWGVANGASGSISRVEVYYGQPAANNAAVAELASPPQAFCAGTYDVQARISNRGQNVISFVTVNWQLDGVTQTPVSWTSALDTIGGSGRSDTVVTLGTVSFPTGVAKTVKVWTSMPNGVADTINSNDTINVSRKPSMSGTYTIGTTGSDYSTIAAAVTDLTTTGVCGPTIFNIRTGTYTGQYTIAAVAGSSAVNTVTFQSMANHRDSVLITYAPTATTDNFVLRLLDAKYVTIKNLSVTSTGATYNKAIVLEATAGFNTIENCKLTCPVATSSTTNNIVLFADPLTGNGNVFRNNLLLNGSYSIYYSGSSTTVLTENGVFEGNTLQNAYAYSTYFYYTNNLKFRNNIITTNSAYATHYGIRSYYGDGTIEITGNKISGLAGGYGMYIYYSDAAANAMGLIANNSITMGTGTNTVQGIRNYYSSYQRIYSNTVNITGTSATAAYAGYFYYSSATYTGNDIRNNVFINSGGGIALYIYNPALAGINLTCDYNHLYTAGATLAQSSAGSYANLAAWRTAYPLIDMNSIFYRPVFTSSTNLAPNLADSGAWVLNGKGIHTSNATDITGGPRPVVRADGAPDMGAYEYTPTALPPMATPVPATAVAGGLQSFVVNTDTVLKITWDMFATPPASVTVRQYSGVKPRFIGSVPYYMFNYTDVELPAGSYVGDVQYFYRDSWLGTMPDETNMVLSGNVARANGSWSPVFFSVLDSVSNRLSAQSVSGFGWFTGENNTAPLPVKLLNLEARITGSDVAVTWATATEENTDRFVIERSTGGEKWAQAGTVKANGNSTSTKGYTFTDIDAVTLLSKAHVVYYRLAMHDVSGKVEYSKAVAVQENAKAPIVQVFPNPGNGKFTVDLAGFEQVVVEVLDATGTKVQSTSMQNGVTNCTIDLTGHAKGMYLLQVNSDGIIATKKLMLE